MKGLDLKSFADVLCVNGIPISFTIEDVVGTQSVFIYPHIDFMKLIYRETTFYVSRPKGTLIYSDGVDSPAEFCLLHSILSTMLAMSVSLSFPSST